MKAVKLTLVMFNLILLAAALSIAPARAMAAQQGWLDCCKKDTSHNPYCCSSCCYFTNDCESSSQCAS